MGSGTCGCQGYDLTQGDDYKTIMDYLPYTEYYLRGNSEDIRRQVIELICSGVSVFGDQDQVS